MLAEAYDRGRADALHFLSKTREYVEQAERFASEQNVDPRELKRSMGL